MTINDFRALVDSGEKYVVKASAPWCVPCKVLDKTLHNVLENKPELKGLIYTVDVDENFDFAQELSISSVPTTFFISGGEYTRKIGVFSEKEILSFFS